MNSSPSPRFQPPPAGALPVYGYRREGGTERRYFKGWRMPGSEHVNLRNHDGELHQVPLADLVDPETLQTQAAIQDLARAGGIPGSCAAALLQEAFQSLLGAIAPAPTSLSGRSAPCRSETTDGRGSPHRR